MNPLLVELVGPFLDYNSLTACRSVSLLWHSNLTSLFLGKSKMVLRFQPNDRSKKKGKKFSNFLNTFMGTRLSEHSKRPWNSWKWLSKADKVEDKTKEQMQNSLIPSDLELWDFGSPDKILMTWLTKHGSKVTCLSINWDWVDGNRRDEADIKSSLIVEMLTITFPNLKKFSIPNIRISGSLLEYGMIELPQLKAIKFGSHQMDNTAVDSLKELLRSANNLECLTFTGFHENRNAFSRIIQDLRYIENLQELDLFDGSIDHTILEYLSNTKFKNLKTLGLGSSEMDTIQIYGRDSYKRRVNQILVNVSHSLEQLRINEWLDFLGPDVFPEMKKMKSLEVRQIYDFQCIDFLCNLTNLESLELCSNFRFYRGIDDQIIPLYLVTNFCSVRVLNYSTFVHKEVTLGLVSSFPMIKVLHLGYPPEQYRGNQQSFLSNWLLPLTNLKNLEDLHIYLEEPENDFFSCLMDILPKFETLTRLALMHLDRFHEVQNVRNFNVKRKRFQVVCGRLLKRFIRIQLSECLIITDRLGKSRESNKIITERFSLC